MIKQKVERIDIWTEGNENPLCFERFYCNGKFMWQIHEDYQVRDDNTNYEHDNKNRHSGIYWYDDIECNSNDWR